MYLQSSIHLLRYYKSLGEKAIAQMKQDELFWQFNEESNSIYIIVKHLKGNMLSRWTDFLQSDGEKEWRERDEEFVQRDSDLKSMMAMWDEGWTCLFNALENLTEEDLGELVQIRGEDHTVIEAINRQLAHYASHVGQIIFIAKMKKDSEWQSLSIPRKIDY